MVPLESFEHSGSPERSRTTPSGLPRWPFAALFVLFPLWWGLGLGETAWIPIALVMGAYLYRARNVRVPKGFGLWLLFLIWMLFSVIEIDTLGRLIGFTYRALQYLTVTVVFLYIYNSRKTLTLRYIFGVLTIFWLVVVAGGFAGIAFPLFSFNTPLAYILPSGLQSNELVGEMTVRRVTQFNPDSWLTLDPRPSAPFLYTNGWGNVYSMLLPIVLSYTHTVRRTRLFVPLLLAIPISLVPAFLTLNRGMFIGLGVAVLYVAIVAVVRGHLLGFTAILISILISIGAAAALDVGQRLDERVSASSTTEDRANLYQETFERTLDSPVFGYGAPRPSETAGAPSAGTQGQIWFVMFSHGFPGLLFFMSWLIWSFISTTRRQRPYSTTLNAVLLIVLVESLYYGIVPNGLVISMTAAAILMREVAPTASLDSTIRTDSVSDPSTASYSSWTDVRYDARNHRRDSRNGN